MADELSVAGNQLLWQANTLKLTGNSRFENDYRTTANWETILSLLPPTSFF